MNTLLHICCAPCANQCIEVLRADGYDVTGLWYNPNIHPFTEYRARRNCLRAYAETIALPLLERNDYGLRPFVRTVVQDLADRCVKCYEMRLFEAARQAREGDLTVLLPPCLSALIKSMRLCGMWRNEPERNMASPFSTGTFARISGPDRSERGSWDFTCKNIAAVFSQRKSGI